MKTKSSLLSDGYFYYVNAFMQFFLKIEAEKWEYFERSWPDKSKVWNKKFLKVSENILDYDALERALK